MDRRLRFVLVYGVAGLIAGSALGTIFEHVGDATESLPELVLTVSAVFILVVGLPVYLYLMSQADAVTHALERLRGFLVMMQTDEVEALPRIPSEELPVDVRQVLEAVDALIAGRLARQALPERQLESVLSAIPDGIAVINDGGLIVLANPAAIELLKSEGLTVGTTIYDVFASSELHEAIGQSMQRGETVEAAILAVDGRRFKSRITAVDGGGVVLVFDSPGTVHAHKLEADLRLLALPPDPIAFNDDTRLEELPYFVFDLETTGLDVETDTVISIGGVRMAGPRVYPAATIDRLVQPDRPIPPRSTAIHHITDDMVAGAPTFPQLWGTVEQLMHGTVLVGHSVGFDIAQLRTATRRAGIEWQPPPFLCTYLLGAALNDGLPSLTLDAIAEAFDVPVRGRHTALGDALLTAEVFARFIPRLMDRGVETLGEAREFAGRRKELIKQQEKSGWWTGPQTG